MMREDERALAVLNANGTISPLYSIPPIFLSPLVVYSPHVLMPLLSLRLCTPLSFQVFCNSPAAAAAAAEKRRARKSQRELEEEAGSLAKKKKIEERI